MTKRYVTNDSNDWYKDAVMYEVHVRAFADSDANGVGDFRGLTEKLDYLRDLGVTTIWLLPFCPSPLRDDGYDIADYTNVHHTYGTLEDFKQFLDEAHKRGLKVITELVVNHTSDQHPWFKRARTAPPGSPERDFYVWSDTSEKYSEARIIFSDTETSNWTWDPVAKAYYWHRFFSHQPDLNYDNPVVKQVILEVLDFWFSLGVDGLRLDAVPYLFEREGTNCENLPETHAVLKELRSYIDSRYAGRMLLAEANQWPEDAVAYFGEGDECHMCFHFPLMPRLFMAVRMEDRFPIVDIMHQTPPIPDNCQWAIFLRNHDELTLEMVTDEDRDYMYRVYAQDPRARINVGIRRRLAPLMGNHRRRIELLNALLFSMPGSPVIYYGDEIGMGDNIYLGDRNGVRTPMQWSSDRNAGFSRANPQRLFLPVIIDSEYHYESVNVEAQHNNPHSLLWWMRRVIALRKRYRAFSRGTLKFVQPDNRKVLVFLREYEDEILLVIANLSRFAQAVELDLSEYRGAVPTEMFGRTPFPPIGELPYFLTLGPHAFYWFSLEPNYMERDASVPYEENPPELMLNGEWTTFLRGEQREELEAILPDYLRTRRWFGGKARPIKQVEIIDSIQINTLLDGAYHVILRVSYIEGEAQFYALPITFATGERARSVRENLPQVVMALVQVFGQEEPGVLYDAVYDRDTSLVPLYSIYEQQTFQGQVGTISASATSAYRELLGDLNLVDLNPSLIRGEQSNTSILYSETFILKLFRRLEGGVNPDMELGHYLTEQCQFANIPALAGAWEYQVPNNEPVTIAMLQAYVPNEGDAFRYTVDVLGRYYERVVTTYAGVQEPEVSNLSLLDLINEPVPEHVGDAIGRFYLGSVRLLGQRTGELHLALAQDATRSEFAPELFTTLSQRSVYQSMRSQAGLVLQTLQRKLPELPEALRPLARQVLDSEQRVLDRMRGLLDYKITATRTRCHGDYHLGQVLFTGKDYMIIDFEGEPARALVDRRRKRSPLLDVAGMLRSFHYAAYTALLNEADGGVIHPDSLPELESWAHLWYQYVAAEFLKSYLETCAGASFVPANQDELQVLLDSYTLDKAIYEINYELNNRPAWVRIPILGVLQLLDAKASEHATS